jgi:hypothetical protein
LSRPWASLTENNLEIVNGIHIIQAIPDFVKNEFGKPVFGSNANATGHFFPVARRVTLHVAAQRMYSDRGPPQSVTPCASGMKRVTDCTRTLATRLVQAICPEQIKAERNLCVFFRMTQHYVD